MFGIPSFEAVRDALLRDTKSFYPNADIGADSDHFVHASRLAACASGQYAHQAWIALQVFPDTADSAYLERHAGLRCIYRRHAVAAKGTAVLSGLAGSRFAADLRISADGRFYETLSDGVIDRDGRANVGIAAVEAGAAGNAADAAGVLMSAPPGLSSDCVLSASGGTDAEGDASLLARLLDVLRRPPAGGNKYDYRNWALSVDGVDAAYVYPLRCGLGTVDVAVTAAGGAPSPETVAKVQAYIDEVRLVTAKNVRVLAPDLTALPVSVRVRTDGAPLEAVREDIRAALSAYFETLLPGDGLTVSKIEAVVSNAAGVADRVLLAPRENRAADMTDKTEWFRLGAVTVEAL